jgi:hypothetical protein
MLKRIILIYGDGLKFIPDDDSRALKSESKAILGGFQV